jgi:hypothetical protein
LFNREHFFALDAFGDLDKIRLMLDDVINVERLIPITSDGEREELVEHLAHFTREEEAGVRLSLEWNRVHRPWGFRI